MRARTIMRAWRAILGGGRPLSFTVRQLDRMSQRVPKVTRIDVERIVRRDFPSTLQAEVHVLLAKYADRESHRVHLGMLKLAGGSLEKLRLTLEMANSDFRDVLASAEYPNYSELVNPAAPPEPAKMEQIIAQDWSQYEEWLVR
jgi:hypothetical protein